MKVRFNWFNISSEPHIIKKRIFKWWNCYNRVCASGNHYWGIGIVQFGHRHLFYIGHSGIYIFFIGETP